MAKAMFDGKVALVTGAASGIGRAAALLFAAEGARVVVADVTPEPGHAVADEIKSAGGDAIYLNCDVADTQAVNAMVAAAVKHFGRLDCAFNNAGVCLDGDAAWEDDAFDKTIAINIKGVMNCMKAEIPEMLKLGGGTIVNTSSIAGFISGAEPAQPGYVGSKHAVIGLTKTAALKYGKQNIRVNAICPGVTMTPMVAQVMALSPQIKEHLENSSPIGRIAQPEEMAEVAIWLCSSRSSFVNGHALVADGGQIVQ